MAEFSVLSDGPKIVFAGLLGLLWWDVRKVRLMKDVILKDVDGKFKDSDGHEKYMTYEKHRDVSKISELEMREYITGKFDEMEKFIEENGK